MQTELGKLLNIRKVSIGGLLDRLERSGFIRRTQDERDRRVNRVYITDSGRKVLEKVDAVGSVQGIEVAKGISKEELKITTKVLLQLHAKIIQLHAKMLDDPAEIKEP
jgi:DNA-binding MarR family transcriptional regulator